MTAIALLVIALQLACAAAAYLWVQRRLRSHELEVQDFVLKTATPILAPDPRVDELMRVVSTMRGAEALKQVYGKSN